MIKQRYLSSPRRCAQIIRFLRDLQMKACILQTIFTFAFGILLKTLRAPCCAPLV